MLHCKVESTIMSLIHPFPSIHPGPSSSLSQQTQTFLFPATSSSSCREDPGGAAGIDNFYSSFVLAWTVLLKNSIFYTVDFTQKKMKATVEIAFGEDSCNCGKWDPSEHIQTTLTTPPQNLSPRHNQGTVFGMLESETGFKVHMNFIKCMIKTNISILL